ncbi:HipA family kinase [Methylocystis iwaonis]|uniref:HipA-like kinase domain-containing protein n=1 Tax=Methylocystis iwaonis TaxID=2885079 RepID=A0ABN6VGQ6_9HYPH|nr:HipA family kinase [Methylocystis iwaonis]BDV33950.1 hypothetical protein SS37A_14790 [Methylocystis iwaonis]
MNDSSEAVAELQVTAGVVGLARVMAGATSFKDSGIANLSDTYRGQILTEGGAFKTAILKDLPPRELANEVLAAGLAAMIGLPVPSAFIGITAPHSSYASRSRLPDGTGLMFASVDVASPSVAQLIVAPSDREKWALLKPIVDVLMQQAWLGDLYGFDAWAANVDRHVGNILFGSGPNVWIIDHGRCFTGPAWVPADLVPAGNFRHRLKEWLTPFLEERQRKSLAVEASALVTRLQRIDVSDVGIQNRVNGLLDEAAFNALVAFLLERIAHVPRAAGNALNEPRLA